MFKPFSSRAPRWHAPSTRRFPVVRTPNYPMGTRKSGVVRVSGFTS